MARYKYSDDWRQAWPYRYVQPDHTCRGNCGQKVKDLASANWMHWGISYFVYCPDCFAKKTAKEKGETNKGDTGKIEYNISDITKACKHAELKARVERTSSGSSTVLAEELDRIANAPINYRAVTTAHFLHNFPFYFTRLAAGKIRGSIGYNDKYRISTFVELARLLKPFLPKISGLMIERLYRKIQPEVAQKIEKRDQYHDWLDENKKLPSRLFVLTETTERCREFIASLLPKGSFVVTGTGVHDDERKARRDLNIPDNVHRNFAVSIYVYNTANGVKFIID